MPWKNCKGKADLKEGGLPPWGKEKKSLEFLFSPWLKFPEVQMDFRRAVDLCNSIGLCCLPLSPQRTVGTELPRAYSRWCDAPVLQRVGSECSVWFCHCYSLVSAELEKLAHSFFVWFLFFPCFHQHAVSCGYQGPECPDGLWTGTGLYSFHTGRKCVCFYFCKQAAQSGPRVSNSDYGKPSASLFVSSNHDKIIFFQIQKHSSITLTMQLY